MFTSKIIRKAVATIVVGLAIGGAAVSTADAKPKRHHQTRAEAHRQLCENLQLIMEGDQAARDAAWEAGDAEAAAQFDRDATRAYTDARHAGCDWAARVIPPDHSGKTPGQAPPPVGIAPDDSGKTVGPGLSKNGIVLSTVGTYR
jgi:hypothetical protein